MHVNNKFRQSCKAWFNWKMNILKKRNQEIQRKECTEEGTWYVERKQKMHLTICNWVHTSVIIWDCLPRSSWKAYLFAPKASHIFRILFLARSPEKKTTNTFFSTYINITKYEFSQYCPFITSSHYHFIYACTMKANVSTCSLADVFFTHSAIEQII